MEVLLVYSNKCKYSQIVKKYEINRSHLFQEGLVQKYGQTFGRNINEVNREIQDQSANPLFKQKLEKKKKTHSLCSYAAVP